MSATVEVQDTFDVFTPPPLPVLQCRLCGHTVNIHVYVMHERIESRLGWVCRPMAAAVETLDVWLKCLGIGYRCNDGTVIFNEAHDLGTFDLFHRQAREAWGGQVDRLDRWVAVRARYLGITDLLAGDRLPSPRREVRP